MRGATLGLIATLAVAAVAPAMAPIRSRVRSHEAGTLTGGHKFSGTIHTLSDCGCRRQRSQPSGPRVRQPEHEERTGWKSTT